MVIAVLGFTGPGFSSQSEVDGEVENGFRVLTLQQGDQIQDFQVYRGDYIKFRLPATFDSAEVVFPTLDEQKTVIKDLETAPYIKMKKAGRFPFEMGSINGTITVIEYQQSRYKTVTVNEAAQFIKQNQPLILDVRTPGEYQAGRIKNAVLLPVQLLQSNLDKLDDFKDRPILVYCATGNRSTVASKIMIDSGFRQIVNLRKGIVDWHKRGFEVVR